MSVWSAITPLYYQSLNFTIETTTIIEQQAYQQCELVQRDQDGKIVEKWFITNSDPLTSCCTLCMDTESNLMDQQIQQAIIVADRKLFQFKDQKIERLNLGEIIIMDCLGIFDGQALVRTISNEFLLVDTTPQKRPMKTCHFEYSEFREQFPLIVPCDDFSISKKYSLCGLFYFRYFYLFNRERREFEKHVIKDSLYSSVSGGGKNIPYREEGKSIRSFFGAQDGRLVEITFDSNNELSAIDHLPWKSDIHSYGGITMIPTEKHGIVYFSFSKCYSYRPAKLQSPLEEGILKSLDKKFQIPYGASSALWSDTLNGVVVVKDLEFKIIPIDFSQSETERYWTKEEIDKEFGVKTYQMLHNHPSITKLTKQDILNDPNSKTFLPFRGEHMYLIDQNAKLSNFEIIKGINCKTSYPKLCSKNYEELANCKEFSNYLGAPLYKGDDEFYFVFDLTDHPSNLKIGIKRENSVGISFIGRSESHAFGILEPKQEDSATENDDENDGESTQIALMNEEWISLMESNEMVVECGKLKIIDFTTDREEESTVIENAQNGNWTATQLIISRQVQQVLLYNNQYAKDHPEIEKDWETPGNIFDSDFDTFDQVINHGWYVSGIIGVDGGVGMIDGDKFEDDSLFKNSKLNSEQCLGWYQVVTELLNESCDEDLIVFPYGLFSKSGSGDGAYPCLYKLNNDDGKVIAVKVAFKNYKAPRRR